MLDTVTAVRWDRRMSSGRTMPSLVACLGKDGQEVEVVLKLSGAPGCNARSLINEALAALLAKDLGLPVPEPYVVQVTLGFAGVITHDEVRKAAAKSIGPNFGSRKLPPGFSVVPAQPLLPGEALESAAEILAFDVFIENSDRQRTQPKPAARRRGLGSSGPRTGVCLDKVLFWKPPWQKGGIANFQLADHVLFSVVRGKSLDFSRLEERLKSLTSQRLQEYGQALPDAWIGDGVAVQKILGYIEELSVNASGAIRRLEERLT